MKERAETANKLQAFLKDLIKFEHHTSSAVELNSFSMQVSRRFDTRMDQYETKVHRNVQIRNWTQGALTLAACIAVFLVWTKVKSLKKKYLL